MNILETGSSLPKRFQGGMLGLQTACFGEAGVSWDWFTRQSKVPKRAPRWWLKQPIWKICSSKWIICPSRGEHKTYLKPPPWAPYNSLHFQYHIFSIWSNIAWQIKQNNMQLSHRAFLPKNTLHPEIHKLKPLLSGWWFQPSWNILVKLDHFPK